jgi:hypothetical protein
VPTVQAPTSAATAALNDIVKIRFIFEENTRDMSDNEPFPVMSRIIEKTFEK